MKAGLTSPAWGTLDNGLNSRLVALRRTPALDRWAATCAGADL